MTEIEPSGSFALGDLEVVYIHDRGELRIDVHGGHLGPYTDEFEAFAENMMSLAAWVEQGNAIKVECHLENFGETLSRTQHVVYRMLNSMRPNTQTLEIHVSGKQPEQEEHMRMAKLFVDGMKDHPGGDLVLVEVE